MTNQIKTWEDARGIWRELIIRVFVSIPLRLLKDKNDNNKSENGVHKWVVRVLSVLVVAFALASITNMISRAQVHHEDAWLSPYLGGAALAAMVPITVFATAVLLKGVRRQTAGWAISSVFAFISASIQFRAYSSSGAWDLEAFAFGAGIPIAECLLAVMAAMVESQIEEDYSIKDKEFIINESDKREQERQEHERERQFQLNLELRRKREEAKINKKYGVHGSVHDGVHGSVHDGVHGSVHDGVQTASDALSTTGETLSMRQNMDSAEHQMDIILRHLMDTGETGAADIAKATGISRPTVYRRMKELVDQGKVIKIGSKWSTISDIPEIQIYTNGTA